MSRSPAVRRFVPIQSLIPAPFWLEAMARWFLHCLSIAMIRASVLWRGDSKLRVPIATFDQRHHTGGKLFQTAAERWPRG